MLLSRVVGAILIDLAAAQDAANEYSSQLSRKYKKYSRESNADEHNILSDFPVPNGLLKGIKLDLKFVINDLDTQAGSEDLFTTAIFTEYARGVAEKAVKLLNDFIDSKKTLLDDQAKKQWGNVQKNAQSSTFLNYLAGKIYSELFQERHILMEPERTLNKEKTKSVIIEALKKYLLEHPDLKPIVTEAKSNEQINESYQREVDRFVNDLDSTFEDLPNRFHNLDVIVTGDRLKDFPADIVSSISINADLTNYQWLFKESSAKLEALK
ncbi:hypothetical protein [Laspinema olomoucense]|uniref:Uncharacterized protein n=1 Tax=Laspinema olomoucense D3b TaxID=2953688 RepID=A0ABT2NAT8_9CYAN|nr:hypothetical protein [Laspinema sp. D3b]MCT7979825.1 hypothetical protein [Laspinema sp. D3b]